jgi:hypothetical protein
MRLSILILKAVAQRALRRSLLVCHDNFCHFLLKFNLRYIFIAGARCHAMAIYINELKTCPACGPKLANNLHVELANSRVRFASERLQICQRN